MEEQYFFDTFGYLTINIPKIDLIDSFEDEISSGLNLEKLDKNELPLENNKRNHTVRFSGFKSDEIFRIFYNPYVLDKIYNITQDFIVLSPIESFYIHNSPIHRDTSSEVKKIKLLFYIDDLSSIEKGPFWILPGSQNLYDKYSVSLGSNINWPPASTGERVSGGDSFINYKDFLNLNIPKHSIQTNKDKIIIFNPNICHGSYGNLINPNILRRAIGMTLICIDRNDQLLMKKVDSFLNLFNIDNTQSNALNYCKKYNLYRWVKHFYKPSTTTYFQYSKDGTDTNAIIQFDKLNIWKNYLSFIEEYDNDKNKTKYNCLTKDLKGLNKLDSDLDLMGII